MRTEDLLVSDKEAELLLCATLFLGHAVDGAKAETVLKPLAELVQRLILIGRDPKLTIPENAAKRAEKESKSC